MFRVEPERMHTTRLNGAALAAVTAVTIGLATLVSGCGGTATKATPLDKPPSTTPVPTAGTSRATTPLGPVTTAEPAKPAAVAAPPTTTHSTTPVAPGAAPSAAQLASVSQDLASAGSALADSQSAVDDSNMNQAKTNEGSAP
jgi:hypothetical protein